MKTLMVAAFAALTAVGAAFADGENGQKPVPATVQAKKGAGVVSPFYRKTGGMIARPGIKPGCVAIFNGQKAVKVEDFNGTVQMLIRYVHVKMPILDWDGTKGRDAAAKMDAALKADANFAIFLVDDAGNPCTLGVFPDQRFAEVNVSALKKDGGEGEFLSARLRKELAKAFLYLCGGASSQASGNIMGGMKKFTDIDKLSDRAIPMDVIGRTLRYMVDSGCNLRTMVPYRTAVMEGWAPAPTNDIQKAIWDKVHEMPSAPIKIKPEAKKVSD